MTDPVVRLDPPRLQVEPGGQGRVTVTVHNPTTIVEGYRLEVLGEGVRDWAEIIPPELRVLPHQEATAVVVLSPPAGTAAPNGDVPFGVLVTSNVDASRSAAEEGDLEVGRVHGTQAKLTPVTSTGRWSGKHVIEVRNWGNAPVRLRLMPADPDRRLGFLIHPEHVDLPVGGSATTAVRVRSRRPFLRGPAVRLPFQIVGEPYGAPGQLAAAPPSAIMSPARPVLDGAFQQRAIVSRGSIMAALLVVVALAGLVWLTLWNTGPPEQRPVNASIAVPSGVEVTALNPTTVRVEWTPAERPDSYLLYQIEPITSGDALPRTVAELPVPASLDLTEVPDLAPGENQCFQLVAIKGNLQSLRSEADCDLTPVPHPETTTDDTTSGSPSNSESTTSSTETTTTTTPPPFTTPPPEELPLSDTEWIIFVLGAGLEDGADRAFQKVEELKAIDIRASVLFSAQYPEAFPGTPEYVVYIRTGVDEDTSDRATARCLELKALDGDLQCGRDNVLQPGAKVVVESTPEPTPTPS